MILAISAYFHPLRIFILNEDGSIRAAYRSDKSNLGQDGFYDLDIKSIIDNFLLDGIKLDEITIVTILGKPIPYFERFIKNCFLKPGIKSAVKFGNGVPVFFQKIFRIRSALNAALRHVPSYYFYSTLEAYARAPSILNWDGDMLFWGINTESVHSILIRGKCKEITFLNCFDDITEKYFLEPAIEKEKIMEQSRCNIPFESGLLVTNPISNRTFSIENNIYRYYDAPTLALVGMCDLFFTNLDRDQNKVEVFREQFFQSPSSQSGKVPENVGDRISLLSQIWTSHIAFKNI